MTKISKTQNILFSCPLGTELNKDGNKCVKCSDGKFRSGNEECRKPDPCNISSADSKNQTPCPNYLTPTIKGDSCGKHYNENLFYPKEEIPSTSVNSVKRCASGRIGSNCEVKCWNYYNKLGDVKNDSTDSEFNKNYTSVISNNKKYCIECPDGFKAVPVEYNIDDVDKFNPKAAKIHYSMSIDDMDRHHGSKKNWGTICVECDDNHFRTEGMLSCKACNDDEYLDNDTKLFKNSYELIDKTCGRKNDGIVAVDDKNIYLNEFTKGFKPKFGCKKYTDRNKSSPTKIGFKMLDNKFTENNESKGSNNNNLVLKNMKYEIIGECGSYPNPSVCKDAETQKYNSCENHVDTYCPNKNLCCRDCNQKYENCVNDSGTTLDGFKWMPGDCDSENEKYNKYASVSPASTPVPETSLTRSNKSTFNSRTQYLCDNAKGVSLSNISDPVYNPNPTESPTLNGNVGPVLSQMSGLQYVSSGINWDPVEEERKRHKKDGRMGKTIYTGDYQDPCRENFANFAVDFSGDPPAPTPAPTLPLSEPFSASTTPSIQLF